MGFLVLWGGPARAVRLTYSTARLPAHSSGLPVYPSARLPANPPTRQPAYPRMRLPSITPASTRLPIYLTGRLSVTRAWCAPRRAAAAYGVAYFAFNDPNDAFRRLPDVCLEVLCRAVMGHCAPSLCTYFHRGTP